MKNSLALMILKPWRARRWLATAVLVAAQTLSVFALPPQDIQDPAGNALAGLPYTSGETSIHGPNFAPTDLALGNSSVNQSAGAPAVVGSRKIIDATTVVFEVVFSEAVTGVNSSMSAVTAVNDSNLTGSVTEVAGGPATYDVTINLTSGLGEFRLDVTAK